MFFSVSEREVAEKLCDKRVKSLQTDAAKCGKITFNIFLFATKTCTKTAGPSTDTVTQMLPCLVCSDEERNTCFNYLFLLVFLFFVFYVC